MVYNDTLLQRWGRVILPGSWGEIPIPEARAFMIKIQSEMFITNMHYELATNTYVYEGYAMKFALYDFGTIPTYYAYIEGYTESGDPVEDIKGGALRFRRVSTTDAAPDNHIIHASLRYAANRTPNN